MYIIVWHVITIITITEFRSISLFPYSYSDSQSDKQTHYHFGYQSLVSVPCNSENENEQIANGCSISLANEPVRIQDGHPGVISCFGLSLGQRSNPLICCTEYSVL